MIFQPEDAPDGQLRVDLISKRLSVGNVSQPFVTKLYRCLAPYETKDTKNRPFSVTVDEILEVLIKDQAGMSCPISMQLARWLCCRLCSYMCLYFHLKSSGWWLVENEEKCLAWFPAPYLELCEDEEEGENELNSAGGQSKLQG